MIRRMEYLNLDKALVIIWLGLISFGFLILNSVLTGHSNGIETYPDTLSAIDKSKITYTFSLVIIVIVIAIPTRFIVKVSKLSLFICLTAACYVLLFGLSINGSLRWVNLNFFEVLKFQFHIGGILTLFFMLFLANRYSYETFWPELNNSFKRVIPILGTCLLFYFVALQPDVLTLTLMLMMAVVFLFLKGTRLIFIFSGLILSMASLFLLLLFNPYRFQRLIAYLDPWSDPFGGGYQLTQSLMAIASGGWSGVGIDKSIIKLGYLPDVQSDFILTLVAEELGLLGVLITLISLSIFALRIYIIGNRNLEYGNRFSACFCWLFSFLLFTNVILHSASVSGLIPTVSVYLPWVSYGNFNFLFLTVLLGIVLRMDLERRLGILPKLRQNGIQVGDRGTR